MNSNKYYQFYVNDEEFIFERQSLMKYNYFRKLLSNKEFMQEDTYIYFDIDERLINVAHNIDNIKVCQLNLNQIMQIYFYLDYLMQDNIMDSMTNMISFYNINQDNDFEIIIKLDVHFKLQLLKKNLDNNNFNLSLVYSDDRYERCYKVINNLEQQEINTSNNDIFFKNVISRYLNKYNIGESKILVNFDCLGGLHLSINKVNICELSYNYICGRRYEIPFPGKDIIPELNKYIICEYENKFNNNKI